MTFRHLRFKNVFLRLSGLSATVVVWMAAASAQTFTTLANFDGVDGGNSLATLIQGMDGSLYGTSYVGGDNGKGLVFRLTPGGALTTLHSFDGTDGANPIGGLVLGEVGSLYGTTYVGGAFGQNLNGFGVVYRIGSDRSFSVMQSFDGTDGQNPEAGMAVHLSAGRFYNNGVYFGTTRLGGVNGNGTVFSVTHSGVLTKRHDFELSDGQWLIGGVTLGDDGNVYGTACTGGANFAGTIFRVTPAGTFTKLHDFDGTDGNCSVGALARGNDGNFYGTASGGGSNNAGTVFRISRSGTFSVLHNFDGTDGSGPGALTLGNDGNFYGAASGGGTNNDGTLFEITPGGELTVLHNFDGTDGQNPYAGLIQHTNGKFYGVTYSGGGHGEGTLFSLNLGRPEFVSLQTTSARVNLEVQILGQHFLDAEDVYFNGVLAGSFHIFSDSYITTMVPAGATSGYVTVKTSKGTFTSAQKFVVKK